MTSLLLALALQAAGQPGELRTFQNWVAGCDNGHACHAVALASFEDEADGAMTLHLRRGPAGEDEPVITIEAHADLCGAALVADGRRLRARIIAARECVIVHPADTTELIDALREGRRLQAIGADGAQLGAVSLDGASAALRHIDDVQGRLETETALVRPGSRGADAVPAPPAVPVVRAAPRPRYEVIAIDTPARQRMRRQLGCEINDVGGPELLETSPLEPGKTLALLSCGSGAYNVSTVPLVVEQQGERIIFRPVEFDAPTGFDEGERPRLINAEWNSDIALLTEAAHGRGLGDCGVRSQYAWDGVRFRLVLREEMSECRGAYDFIRTWRARIERPEAP